MERGDLETLRTEIDFARMVYEQHPDPQSLWANTFQDVWCAILGGDLENAALLSERALTLCDGTVIRPEDVELRGPPTFEESVPPHRPGTLPQTLEDMERASIRKALEDARYNKTAAARALGISFRALRYRIKKLGIE